MMSRDGVRQFVLGMQQAREASERAWGLLEDNADPRLVVESLRRVYSLIVLALLHAAGAGQTVPAASFAVFEQLFRGTGIIDERHFPLIRMAFDLRPKRRSTAAPRMDRAGAAAMLKGAQAFHLAATAAAEEGLLDKLAGRRRGPAAGGSL